MRCASVRWEGGDGAGRRTQSVGTEEAVSEDSKRPWIRNEQCPLNLANRRSLGDSIAGAIIERKLDTSALIFLHCALVIVKGAEKKQFWTFGSSLLR